MAISRRNNGCTPALMANCYKMPYLIEPILDCKLTSKLEDRYVLGEQLGSGQFGLIRTCLDKTTGEMLACKSIAKDKLSTLEDVRSVKLEIEIMATLSGHPNIVDLKAVFEEEDHVHLVMELCAGGELFHRLQKRHFSEPEAVVLFKHLMEVIHHCHEKGIVHRDLKPENILLSTTSPSSPIKLADFGLATYIRPGQSLYGRVGSPFYIAPEVLKGGYNQAADVWSAGVILYILLSGVPPFWGSTKSTIFEAIRAADLQFPYDTWGNVSAAAKDLISQMLRKDPKQRFTAAQVLDHPWIKNSDQMKYERLFPQGNLCASEVDFMNGSFSLRSGSCAAAADRDGMAETSPTFTCKSSFSSFLANSTTRTPSSGFSFRSCCDSRKQESSSPISQMPSFAFFSPCDDQTSNDDLKLNTIERDVSFGKMFAFSPVTADGKAVKKITGIGYDYPNAEFPCSSEQPCICCRRNRTIGLGELEQLDLMVTESIIRWASCTHPPNGASLSSSLVC